MNISARPTLPSLAIESTPTQAKTSQLVTGNTVPSSPSPELAKQKFTATRQSLFGQSPVSGQTAVSEQTLMRGLDQVQTGNLIKNTQRLNGAPSGIGVKSQAAFTPKMLVQARQILKPVSQHQVLSLDASNRIDSTLAESSRSLKLKTDGSAFAPERLGKEATLDIVAHGASDGSTLGGQTPQQLARFLKQAGVTQLGVLDLKSCHSESFRTALEVALTEAGLQVGQVKAYTGPIAISRATGQTLTGPTLAQVSGHDGALGIEDQLLNEAYSCGNPLKALSNAKQILAQSNDPYYCLHAIGLLNKLDKTEAKLQLENLCGKLDTANPALMLRKAEFQMEAGKHWELLEEPAKALSTYAQAAASAETQRDDKTLFALGRLLDQPQTRQEAITCMRKGIAAVIDKSSTGASMELADSLLDNLDYWSKLPGVWSETQPLLPEVGKLINVAVTQATDSKQAQQVMDLAEKYMLLDSHAIKNTPLEFSALDELAQKMFKSADNLVEATMIAHQWTQTAAKIANSYPDHGALASFSATGMLTALQEKIATALTENIQQQQKVEATIKTLGSPPGPELGEQLRKCYHTTESLNEQMLSLQVELIDSAMIKTRSTDSKIRTSGVEQVNAARDQLTKILDQPDFIGINETGWTNYAPIFKNKALESLIQASDHAVSLGHLEGFSAQMNTMLKASQAIKDPALDSRLDQLILSTARRVQSGLDTEASRNFTSGLLTQMLPRFASLQTSSSGEQLVIHPRVEKEQVLELARLMQPFAPVEAAKLTGLIATQAIEAAQKIGLADPGASLMAMNQALDAIRIDTSATATHLEAVKKGVLTLVQYGAEKQDVDLLGQAVQLARVYLSKPEMEATFSDPLVKLAAGMPDKPDSALTTLRQVSEFTTDRGLQFEVAKNLLLIGQTAIKQHGDGLIAQEATEALMAHAYQMKRAGHTDYVELQGPLTELVSALRSSNDGERVNILIRQGERLFEGLSSTSAFLGQTPHGSLSVDFKPTLESDFSKVDKLTVFKYKDEIEKARIHKDTMVVHYRSLGHPDPKTQTDAAQDVDLKVEKFSQIVGRKSQIAFEELKSQQFGGWDISKGHYQRKCVLKDQWDKVKGAYKLSTAHAAPADKETQVSAVFYDLQRVGTIGRKGIQNDYDRGIDDDWSKAEEAAKTDSSKSTEAHFIERRQAIHGNPDDPTTKFAASESTNMLSTLGGYLIEERTYQLLKADVPSKEQILPWLGDKVSWTDQDTDILGASTRPDLSLKIPGHDLHLLMDFTAFKSNGHIFDKKPSWTNNPKIADSVEVLYPSMTQTELKSFILEGKSLSPEEIKKVQEAYAAEQKAIADRKKAVESVVGTVHKDFARAGYLNDLPGLDAEMKKNVAHMAKRFGLRSSPDFEFTSLDFSTRTEQKRVTAAMDFYLESARDILKNPGKFNLYEAVEDEDTGDIIEYPAVTKLLDNLDNHVEALDKLSAK